MEEDEKPEGAATEEATPENGEEPSDVVHQLVITVRRSGTQIHGPIDDPVLCYGLLEFGKDMIRARQAERQAAEKPRILGPHALGGIPGVTRIRR